MELTPKYKNHAEIYHNGSYCGWIEKRKDFYLVEINYKQYTADAKHKQHIKGWIEAIINGNSYEVYSEIVAEIRGFKILG